jgi:hypothetical protein
MAGHVSVLAFVDPTSGQIIGFQHFEVIDPNHLRYYSTYAYQPGAPPLDIKITSTNADFPPAVAYCNAKLQQKTLSLLCDPDAPIPAPGEECYKMRICIPNPTLLRSVDSEAVSKLETFKANYESYANLYQQRRFINM